MNLFKRLAGYSLLLRGRLYKNFAELPLWYRQWHLSSKLVQEELLFPIENHCGLREREFFAGSFLFPERDAMEKLNINVFSNYEMSAITALINDKGNASHEALDVLYRLGFDKLGHLDSYFLKCPAGSAIADRLRTVIREFPKWVKRSKRPGEKARVLIPGCGSSIDVVTMLRDNAYLRENAEFVCVDNQETAIARSKFLARENKVEEYITFICQDMRDLNLGLFDIIQLVGVICPQKLLTSRMTLSTISKFLRRGGHIVVSAARQAMLVFDPVTTCVMDVIGWKLCYKTVYLLKQIIKPIGLRWVALFREGLQKCHDIFVAQKI